MSTYSTLAKDIDVIIYKPLLEQGNFLGSNLVTNIDVFKNKSDVILANRMAEDISDVKSKVFTRDITGENKETRIIVINSAV